MYWYLYLYLIPDTCTSALSLYLILYIILIPNSVRSVQVIPYSRVPNKGAVWFFMYIHMYVYIYMCIYIIFWKGNKGVASPKALALRQILIHDRRSKSFRKRILAVVSNFELAKLPLKNFAYRVIFTMM